MGGALPHAAYGAGPTTQLLLAPIVLHGMMPIEAAFRCRR